MNKGQTLDANRCDVQSCTERAEHSGRHRNRKSITRRRYEKGQHTWRAAMQLLRGDILMDVATHHVGMARLKELFGDPRPPGTDLSLVVFDGPGVYWAHGQNGRPHLVSRLMDDYAWESRTRNLERRQEHVYWKLERAACT